MMIIQPIRGTVIVFKSTRMRIRCIAIGQEKEREDRIVDARQRRLEKKNVPGVFLGLWFYRNQK